MVRHECLQSISLPRIRENCIYIQTYKPEGFTKSGLFIDPKKGPAIWGHVMATPTNIGNYTHVEMTPGDMVLFHRYADEVVLIEGNLVLSVVHIKSIEALFTPPLVEFKCTN